MQNKFLRGALAFAIGFALAGPFGVLARAQTASADIPCPNDEPCQVLVLTKTEIGVLTGDNGILATAAQARSLDLGQFVSYFRQKLALAPVGKNATKQSEGAPKPAGPPEAAKK